MAESRDREFDELEQSLLSESGSPVQPSESIGEMLTNLEQGKPNKPGRRSAKDSLSASKLKELATKNTNQSDSDFESMSGATTDSSFKKPDSKPQREYSIYPLF